MYHFIANPNARSGQGLALWEKIKLKLIAEHIDYQIHFTHHRHHATEFAAELTAPGDPVTIVVLGGDGSVDEVICGLQNLSRVTLGYIPIGSGNDFGRGLALPSDTMKALDLVLHSEQTRKINLGVLHYHDKVHRFAVSSGIGYDAAICHQLCISRVKVFFNRLGLGKLAYAACSLYRLRRCQPDEMEILLDDTKRLHFKRVFFASAFNLPYEGGGCKFCPDAKPDDDLLDFIVIANVPKIIALAILPTVFSGKHTRLPGVHIFRCKKAEVHSKIALPVHSDGEPIYLQKDVSFSLEPETLKIIT